MTALAKTVVFFIASKKDGKTSKKGGKTSAKGDNTSAKDGEKTVVNADSHVPPPRSKSPDGAPQRSIDSVYRQFSSYRVERGKTRDDGQLFTVRNSN
jgi:hypothetical protein